MIDQDLLERLRQVQALLADLTARLPAARRDLQAVIDELRRSREE